MMNSTLKFINKPQQEYINDFELIEQVRVRDFLYETKHPDYRNLPRRNEAWAEIAILMNVKDAQKVALRWKTVREKFAVKYKKFHFSRIDPTWEFYDQCLFLTPFVNLSSNRKKSSKGRDSDEDDNSSLVAPIRFDEAHLIEFIRQRPVIYDRNDKDFRSASIRNKAWKDISNATGWNLEFMQKRWRVIRDRFVRELRKTNYSKRTVSTSPIFGNLLFLAPHIKSKTYAVEAEFEDYSNDEDSSYDAALKSESFDQTSNENLQTDSEVIEEEVDQETEEMFDGNNSCYQLYEEAEVLEEMHEDHNLMKSEREGEYTDDDAQVETIFENDDEYLSSVAFEQEEVDSNETESNIATQEVCATPVSRKRKISASFEEISSPMKIVCAKTITVKDEQESTKSINEMSMTMRDEDLAFGQTIGLMLKKIPNKLKTAIKLKIFQCLDDFELQHNLK